MNFTGHCRGRSAPSGTEWCPLAAATRWRTITDAGPAESGTAAVAPGFARDAAISSVPIAPTTELPSTLDARGVSLTPLPWVLAEAVMATQVREQMGGC